MAVGDWWIGLEGGAGYKDIGPFKTEEDAKIYAAETGMDREGRIDHDYDIWEEVEEDVLG